MLRKPVHMCIGLLHLQISAKPQVFNISFCSNFAGLS